MSCNNPRLPLKTPLFRLFLCAFVFLTLCSALPAAAFCTRPSSPGMRICFPTEGSTVMYAPAIELAVTTANSNAYAVKTQVYDNGILIDEFDSVPGTLVDGAIKNGWHKVTIKVWDSNGTVYQATRTFRVIGFGVDFCATPSTAGVNLCWPQTDSWQPNTSVPISATARGSNSKIKSLSVYVDGKSVLGTGNNYILTGVDMTAGRHRVAVVAQDYAGHTYKTTHYFNTYYNYGCNPKSGACSPGITLNNLYDQDVTTSFRLNADVVNNPLPTTSMKVYLDGAVVATSTGPGITKQLNLPSGSTHILWVKAWDTAGKMYATYQTIYVH